MIFKVLKDVDFFEANPEASLIEQFSVLTSDEMKYTSLVYDFDSPFRNIPIVERKEKILHILNFKKRGNSWNKKILSMLDGVEKKYGIAAEYYRSLMKDLDKSTLFAYESQMEECQDFLSTKGKTSSDMKTAMQMQKMMEESRSVIKKLKEEIEIRDQVNEYLEEESVGSESLSLVEEINNSDYEVE